MRAIGQPRVVGEMIAGVALGPSLFGVIAPSTWRALFPIDHMVPLAALSQFGVLLFMLVIGLRVNRSEVRERAGTAIAVSQASIAVPFILGALIATLLYPSLAGPGVNGKAVALLPFALFVGTAMSITAFPVLARILIERKMIGTPLGSVAIACAAADDVTAWFILAGIVTIARAAGGTGAIAIKLLIVAAIVGLAITIGRRGLRYLDRRRVTKGSLVDADTVGLAVLLALALGLVTEAAGVHALFGAFLAGVIMPRESNLARELADRIEPLVATVLLPIFFAYTGLLTQIGLLHGPAMWTACASLILVAVAGKFGGSTGAARLTGMSWKDSMTIGILMNTRGLMELVVLNIGLELGVISPTLFAMLVLMALVTTIMTSPLLQALQRRPITTGVSSRS